MKALLQYTQDMVQNESEDVKRYISDPLEERINKVEPTMKNSTPLHVSAEEGHTETVSLLLTHRANIETKDEVQYLMFYCILLNWTCVELLMRLHDGVRMHMLVR